MCTYLLLTKIIFLCDHRKRTCSWGDTHTLSMMDALIKDKEPQADLFIGDHRVQAKWDPRWMYALINFWWIHDVHRWSLSTGQMRSCSKILLISWREEHFCNKSTTHYTYWGIETQKRKGFYLDNHGEGCLGTGSEEDKVKTKEGATWETPWGSGRGSSKQLMGEERSEVMRQRKESFSGQKEKKRSFISLHRLFFLNSTSSSWSDREFGRGMDSVP